MEDCFKDIDNTGADYERAKCYCRADFSAPEASTITEVKTMKEPGQYYRCGRPDFQNILFIYLFITFIKH